jgi:hypothetical protein
MKNSIDFTPREQLVASYYRDEKLSSPSRYLWISGAYMGISLVFMALAAVWQDVAWAVIGYGILLWRVVRSVWSSRHYTQAFREILRKYDARIEELERAAGKES